MEGGYACFFFFGNWVVMLVTLGIKGKSGIGIVKYLALDTLRLVI